MLTLFSSKPTFALSPSIAGVSSVQAIPDTQRVSDQLLQDIRLNIDDFITYMADLGHFNADNPRTIQKHAEASSETKGT